MTDARWENVELLATTKGSRAEATKNTFASSLKIEFAGPIDRGRGLANESMN